VLDWDIGFVGKLAWSGVALVLAWLTHRWIERPSREGKLATLPTGWIAPAALGASVATAMVAHVAMTSAVRATSVLPQRAFAAARVDRFAQNCWVTTVDEWKTPCVVGDRSSSTTIALLGDSHAEHWLSALDRIGKERGWR